MNCTRTLFARGRRIADFSRSIGVSCAKLSVRINRTSDWQDRRRQPVFTDGDELLRIKTAVADLPTYGYRTATTGVRAGHVTGYQCETHLPDHRVHHLLLGRKPSVSPDKRAHKRRVAVAESNRRWCSDSFEFRCENGKKLRMIFAQACCYREVIN